MNVVEALRVAFFALLIFAFFFEHLLIRRLKLYHHGTWVEMGSPSVFAASLRTRSRYRKFLFSKDRLNLNDEGLNRLVTLKMILGPILVALVVILVGIDFFG